MAKNILFNDKARESLKRGIDKLSDAVSMTLGPRGRAVVIEKGYGTPQVTFDGVTVAKEVELDDRFENLGADLIKQAADKTNDNVGDGTTTSVVLAHAMIDEGENIIRDKGVNVIQLAQELKNSSEQIIKFLDDQKESINDSKKIEEVATLSAKNQEIGRLIAEVMDKIGKEGVISIEDSNTIANSYEIVEGMQFDRGYIAPYMVTNAEKMQAVLENPNILVTDKKISSIQDILPLLEKLLQAGKKELVIVAEDVEGEALTTMIVNKLRGIFTVLAIKAPGFGDRRKEMLQDICIVTGANFISEEMGRKLDSATIEDLGQAHKVISNKDNTTIVGGNGPKEEIQNRISQLKNQLKHTESGFDKEKLQERLGKLAGGVAVIKVGAPTESAQKELKQRVEDAVSATRAAMEEGIVPGGGIALFNICKTLRETPVKGEISIPQAAQMILLRAAKAPLRAIIENSGANPEKTMEKIMEEKDKSNDNWMGFNAMTNKIDDLKKLGIIDPLKVVKTAFLNAVSVAANYLTIGAALTEKPEPKDKHNHGMPGAMDY